jgi:hypothetical protein
MGDFKEDNSLSNLVKLVNKTASNFKADNSSSEVSAAAALPKMDEDDDEYLKIGSRDPVLGQHFAPSTTEKSIQLLSQVSHMK